jgi:ATP-dependent Clp protease adaptor protein ClpS
LEPEVQEAFARMAVDGAAISRTASSWAPKRRWCGLFRRRPGAPGVSALLSRAAAQTLARGRDLLEPLVVIEALLVLATADERASLASHGLALLPLRRLLAHGSSEPPTLTVHAPATSELQVMLHNDDLTTMDFVVELLEEVFGLEPDEAIQRMMDVHHGTKVAVGQYPAPRARELAEAALERAAAADFPLVLSLEPA